MENLIEEVTYGAVLALWVIDNYILVYYENMHLVFYDINAMKTVFDMVLYENREICISDLSLKLFVVKKNNLIKVKGENFLRILSVYDVSSNNAFRLKKEFDNGLSIESNYSSLFTIKDKEGQIIMVGRHNNWISDACIIDGMLYTVGYDSCIKKWDILKETCVGYYALKIGGITSLANSNEELYIGTQFGRVLRIPIKEIINDHLNMGAIWNIYRYFDKIYAVSEDGRISLYDLTLTPIKGIHCSNGWINALSMYKDDLVAVSSYGEIIYINSDLNKFDIILKMNYWFNSIVIKETEAYIASAEGYILKVDLRSKKYNAIKVSRYQLIDIVFIGKQIDVAAADVEGNIFFLNKDLKVVNTISISEINITSMCYNQDKRSLYVSTMDGVVAKIDICNNFEYHLTHVGEARIWKVDYSIKNKKVALITTLQEIVLFDEELKTQIMRKKCTNFFTTCKIDEDCILCGDDKGNITCHEIIESYGIDSGDVKVDKIHKEINSKIEGEIILYYDDSKYYSSIYKIRDEKILDLCGFTYREINIAHNNELKKQVIKCSRWSGFPQIFFYGHFVSSGSVLPQMFENGTLERCVKSICE